MESKTTASPAPHLTERRGDYGIDAPGVLTSMFVGGLVFLAAGLLGLLGALLRGPLFWLVAIAGLLVGLVLLLDAAIFFHTTRFGKFQVWTELLADLKLRGDEQVLDLGCGRGMVLLMVAALLPQGKATGVDIWSLRDQSGNAQDTTLKNARLEGVADRIELHTADMRDLSFADNTFDLVVSSLAIHNIIEGNDTEEGRTGLDKALDEALRVLKPGGRFVIVDIYKTNHYVDYFRAHGASEVTCKLLDWRFWYGFPSSGTTAKLFTGSKDK